MDAPPGKRALPETLPAWSDIDSHAPAWMVRRLPKGEKAASVAWTLTTAGFRAVYRPSKTPRKVEEYVREKWNRGKADPNEFPKIDLQNDGSVVASFTTKTLPEAAFNILMANICYSEAD